ncbi:MAG: DUF4236 domain-containing protein [Elusimicrobia bacterium]|nr:DUF4236 domain-containing protein [Elusimicrobiota bacterium]
MGFRFRKSISLGKGLRLNIGKKGLGLSAGVKGLRVGVGNKGVYTRIGIPKTGLGSVNYLGKGKKTSQEQVSYSSNNHSPGCSVGCVFVFLYFIGFILLLIKPIIGFFVLLIMGIVNYTWYSSPTEKAKRKLQKSKKHISEQNYEESIKCLLEANNIDPKNEDIIYLLGKVLHEVGKYSEAILYFKVIFDKYPEDYEIKLLIGNCYYKINKFDEALNVLQKIPEEFEEYLKVIQLLGACFAQQKKYDLAIEVLKKAPLQKRNLDDDLLEVHYSLALVYELSGDNKNALKHYKKVYTQNISYRDVADKIKGLEK